MSYGAHEVVRGIDLTVERGEIVAFLGPNGAGKTTTVEILEGFRRRTAGDVRVLGEDPATAGAAWRERVGVVLQASQAEGDLTVRETLTMHAGYYSAPRDVSQTIALVGLEQKADERTRRLSGGQVRRLDVALGLIGDPELIFLDEPTTGFDPSARHQAWKVVEELGALGKTVFLTTHYMDEAEHLADRIVILRAGAIVAEGTPATLGARDRAEAELEFTPPAGVAPPAELGAQRLPDGRLRIATATPASTLLALTTWATAVGTELEDLAVRRPTLEDTYLRLTEGDAA